MTDYFSHPYCSNSTLNALGQELGMFPEIKGDREEAYRIGSLFDAVVTEPHKIDLIQNRILDTEYSFTKEEYKNALAMQKSLMNHPLFLSFVMAGPDFQKEVYEEDFEFNGFSLSMRAKLDFYLNGIVGDLKSTVATSQKGFNDSVELFGYHRQMWLYCKLTKAKRAVLFGVQKSRPHKVYVFQIQEGDSLWRKAEQEITVLAYKYYLMN